MTQPFDSKLADEVYEALAAVRDKFKDAPGVLLVRTDSNYYAGRMPAIALEFKVVIQLPEKPE